MATIKKTSKSMSFQNEKSNSLDKAIKALESGAKIVEDIKGYAIEYPTGGYFKISNSVYKVLKSI